MPKDKEGKEKEVKATIGTGAPAPKPGKPAPKGVKKVGKDGKERTVYARPARFNKSEAELKAVSLAMKVANGKLTRDEANAKFAEMCQGAMSTGKAGPFNQNLLKAIREGLDGSELKADLTEQGVPYILGGKKPDLEYKAEGTKGPGAPRGFAALGIKTNNEDLLASIPYEK